MAERFDPLAARIRACRVCQPALAHPCRPVLQGSAGARIRIVGQAPGTRVQAKLTEPLIECTLRREQEAQSNRDHNW
jgi:uracil-DNA glycosylase